MLTTLALTAGGLAALYFGGDVLIRGASALAARVGVSPLAVGLTVVAFGTSAPELVVSVAAALTGANDIAVGNVVGSNITNVGLILGVAALVRPLAVEAKIVKIDAPIMIVVSLVLSAILLGGTASRSEGLLLLFGLAGYVAYTFWEARREPRAVREEFASAAPTVRTGLAASTLLALSGIGLLALGGHLLVTAAVDLATLLGVSQAAIGLTVVAVGTSLPELTTSVLASRRGQGDIAIGNVVGSNIFNILGILGTTAVIQPLALGDITRIDLGVMVLLACVVTVLLFTRLQLDRVEGGLLLASYVAYTGWLLGS